jgi:hypothetical protein
MNKIGRGKDKARKKSFWIVRFRPSENRKSLKKWTYFAMILPGIAMLRVCDLPFPVAWNRAVGLEVSSSSARGAWWRTTFLFLFCSIH